MIIPTYDNTKSPRSIDQKINEIAIERTNRILSTLMSDLERIKSHMETTFKTHRVELRDSPDLEILIKKQVSDIGDILQKMGRMIE